MAGWTEYQRNWYYENQNREKLKRKEYARRFREEFPEKRLFQAAKNRATTFGIPFNLEMSDIVIPETCPVFGVPFERNTKWAPSLDKIDPTLGYVKGNVQVISRFANAMKRDANSDELQRFANWIINQKQSTV